MARSSKNIFFRRGFRKNKAMDVNLSALDEVQLLPNSPILFVEKKNILSTNDIVNVYKGGNKNDGFFITIEFIKDTINMLNQLCEEEKFPILVLYIRDIPYYSVHLMGPFNQPILRWNIGNDEDEIDLLISNLIQ